VAGREKASARNRDPELDAQRRTKIAASKVGKSRPQHVRDAIGAAGRGRPQSETTRRKRSETHRRSGHRPPWLNPAWTAEEDELVRSLKPKEVAARTGRTLVAVLNRRQVLTRRGEVLKRWGPGHTT
jgi:hypothetical protein